MDLKKRTGRKTKTYVIHDREVQLALWRNGYTCDHVRELNWCYTSNFVFDPGDANILPDGTPLFCDNEYDTLWLAQRPDFKYVPAQNLLCMYWITHQEIVHQLLDEGYFCDFLFQKEYPAYQTNFAIDQGEKKTLGDRVVARDWGYCLSYVPQQWKRYVIHDRKVFRTLKRYGYAVEFTGNRTRSDFILKHGESKTFPDGTTLLYYGSHLFIAGRDTREYIPDEDYV